MLPKRNRLTFKRWFDQTLGGPRVYSSPRLAMAVLWASTERPKTGETRFGFIVSKKVDKRATVRNRIRRRMREWVRTCLLTQPPEILADALAVVIIARNASATAEAAQLGADLKAGIDRMGHRRPAPSCTIGTESPGP